MNLHVNLKAALLVAGLLSLPLAQAATMTKAEHSAAKTRISADYKADKAACKTQTGNAKDVCEQEAEAKEKVAKAELEYSYTGKPADQTKLMKVKAETAYDVAKEKCDDKAGNDKDVCLKEAKAVEVKALADAKLGQKMGDAKRDATADKRDADYKVAAEKCDAMAGDAKASCISAAKVKFGKS